MRRMNCERRVRGRPSPRYSHGKHGFTLVELLTVVAIIAVAITLAAPSFSQVSASNSSRRIAFDLYTAL
ncbi:MAG: Tfp pilus assembly protein FimT/FimU, partial [Bdellovibrio bacteriovorus]